MYQLNFAFCERFTKIGFYHFVYRGLVTTVILSFSVSKNILLLNSQIYYRVGVL